MDFGTVIENHFRWLREIQTKLRPISIDCSPPHSPPLLNTGLFNKKKGKKQQRNIINVLISMKKAHCFLFRLTFSGLSSRSSGVDSDRATESRKKKKKKKKKQRDSEPLDSASSHRSRGGEEERRSHKRGYYDVKGTKQDKGFPLEKYRKLEDDADRSDRPQASSDIPPPDPQTYHHLNGFKGMALATSSYCPSRCDVCCAAQALTCRFYSC